MFIFLASIAAFIYLLSRINNLERKVVELQGVKLPQQISVSPSVSVPAQSTPQAPVSIPVPQKPISISSFIPKAEPSAITHSDGTEFAVGAKLFTAIGVIALFIGVGFFLRYAIQNNWINEPMRVMLGITFGLIVAGTGHFLKRKYESYGLTLVGGGVGIIYLSVYAAYAFYGLITLPIAFVILAIVTALGAALSVYYNSLPLISYSLVGAFFIPLLLPMSDSVHTLFVYLLILNIGVLLIARYKIWPGLTAGSLIGTTLISLNWVGLYGRSMVAETLMYLTVIYLVYIVTTIINYIRRDRNYRGVDGFILYAVPTAYFILSANVLEDQQEISILLLGMGIFYAIGAILLRVALKHEGEITKLSNIMLVIASIGFVGATALHFEGSTLTIFWALEAVAMFAIGIVLNTRANRMAAIILAFLTVLRALVSDMVITSAADPFFNERSLVLACVALPFIIFWLYYHLYQKQDVLQDEKLAGRFVGALGIYSILFLWITLEAFVLIKVKTYLYLPLIWTLFMIVTIAISFVAREKIFRYCSYMLAVIVGVTLFFSQWSLPQDYYFTVTNIRVLSTVVFIAVIALVLWLFTQYADQITKDEKTMAKIGLATIIGFIFWLISLEVLDFFNNQIRSIQNGQGQYALIDSIENTKRVALSAAWLVYALVSLAVGIIYRSVFVRYFSMGLFMITILKIFLYDTSNLSDIYRFVSYISLGIILLLAGFAYYRFKDRIIQFVHVEEQPRV